MEIHIAVQGHHDLSGQIYRQLRAGILEGRLAGGTRLPSTRDLAAQLGVSRKTTLDVFERLLSEGYLTALGCTSVGVRNGTDAVSRSATERFDLILGADVIYAPRLQPFLRTIFATNLAPGGRLLLGDPFRSASIRMLEAMGHHVAMKPSMGATETIMRSGGLLLGAADTRERGGLAAGY